MLALLLLEAELALLALYIGRCPVTSTKVGQFFLICTLEEKYRTAQYYSKDEYNFNVYVTFCLLVSYV